MRAMELADRHGFPVITLVDTPGAYPGVTAEQHGQGGWIARCQLAMARLEVPSVACVIGEGGSGGAVAIAVADRVLMQENAIYSVISPEGCAAILWRDAGEAKKAAAAFKPDARHCLELGVIDAIVPEPPGGAHADHDAAAVLLAESLRASLAELEPLDPPSADACGDASSAPWASTSSRGRELSNPQRPQGYPRRPVTAACGQQRGRPGLPTPIGKSRPAVSYPLAHSQTPACFGRGAPSRLRAQAEQGHDPGAVRRASHEGKAGLRRPAPRRAPPPLRLPPRTERRARELGRPEGHSARDRGSGTWPSTSRTTRSTTRTSRARSRPAQYGAGTVEIWDRGTYELVEEKPDGGLTVRLARRAARRASGRSFRHSSTATRRTGS